MFATLIRNSFVSLAQAPRGAPAVPGAPAFAFVARGAARADRAAFDPPQPMAWGGFTPASPLVTVKPDVPE